MSESNGCACLAAENGNRDRLVDLLFAVVIALTAATRWRFVAQAFGPAEIAGALACVLVLVRAWGRGGVRGLCPGGWFLLAWGVVWVCAVAGSLSRLTFAEGNPAGFWHNALAVAYVTVMCWAFWLEYRAPVCAPAASAGCSGAAAPVSVGAGGGGRLRRMIGLAGGLSLALYGSAYLLTVTGATTAFLFQTPQGSRFAGLATNPNQMALLAMVAFCLCAYLARATVGWRRYFWLAAALVQLFVMWGTRSDIGKGLCVILPGIFIGAWVLTLLRKWLPAWRTCVVMVVALTLVGTYFVVSGKGIDLAWQVQGLLREKMASEREEGNLKYRLKLLENACTVIERSPVWGAGFGAQIEYDQVFPAFPQGREAHNTPVDIALAAGLLGLLAAMLAAARAVWNVWRGGNWVLLGCLVAMGIFGTVHNYMRHPAVWFFVLFCLLWRREWDGTEEQGSAGGRPDEPGADTLAPAADAGGPGA